MAIINLSDNNYEEIVKDGVVLVDFYAEWCGPCKMLAPVLDKFANERSNIKVLKVNIDTYPDIAQSFGIMSVPSLLLYKNGNVVDQRQGFMTIDMLNEWLMN